MTIDANERLEQALSLFGYRDDMPSHHRSNLLHSIKLFAGVSGDERLEFACDAQINLIRAENDAARQNNEHES